MNLQVVKNLMRCLIKPIVNPAAFLKIIIKAIIARNQAFAIGGPGLKFDTFGRRIGWKLILKCHLSGIEYLLHPIVHVRYFEFSFAFDNLPKSIDDCLDISSPRLFSFFVSKNIAKTKITMLNPDSDDVEESLNILGILDLSNIIIKNIGIAELDKMKMLEKFDAIWSISVIEHIEGSLNDSDAVRIMYQALRKKGRLILTIPVDRNFRIETSETKQYGTQPRMDDGTYYFQRIYDMESIKIRLSQAVGKEPAVIRWFGESQCGWYNNYYTNTYGHAKKWSVTDVAEIALNFREYESWEKMPGMGICGVVYEK
jgi:hypothetical protein